MTNAEAKREILYQVTMSMARSWLDSELISKEEYKAFELKMRDKYNPLTEDVFTEVDLSDLLE